MAHKKTTWVDCGAGRAFVTARPAPSRPAPRRPAVLNQSTPPRLAVSLVPRGCPRFDHCNAAVGPLGKGGPEGVHLPGETVCYYLLNSGKDGAALRFADDPVFAACLARLPEVVARWGDIRSRVAAAAR